MKLRIGFVSNSSSTSFLFAGFPILKPELTHLEDSLKLVLKPLHKKDRKKQKLIDKITTCDRIQINKIRYPLFLELTSLETPCDSNYFIAFHSIKGLKIPRIEMFAATLQTCLEAMEGLHEINLLANLAHIFYEKNKNKQFYSARFDDCYEPGLEGGECYETDFCSWNHH